MIEKIESTYERTNLGIVRIDAEKLVDILEKNISANQTIRIEVNNSRMIGLDDIRQNLPLLEGQPNIEITDDKRSGVTSIEFERFGTAINSHNAHVGVEHRKYTNIFRKFRTLPARLSFLLWPTLFSALIIGVIGGFIDIGDQRFKIAPLVISLILIGGAFIGGVHSIIFPNFVSYVPRHGFLKRNLDNILVGIVMLVIGAVVGVLFK